MFFSHYGSVVMIVMELQGNEDTDNTGKGSFGHWKESFVLLVGHLGSFGVICAILDVFSAILAQL